MNKLIIVEVKEYYGNKHIYIVSEHKESIKALTGRKTITETDILALKKLGFTFKQNLISI